MSTSKKEQSWDSKYGDKNILCDPLMAAKLLIDCGTQAVKSRLQEEMNFEMKKQDLVQSVYKFLSENQRRIDRKPDLKPLRAYFTKGVPSSLKQFDLAACFLVFEHLTSTKPLNGWKVRSVGSSDKSLGGNLMRLKLLRNEIFMKLYQMDSIINLEHLNVNADEDEDDAEDDASERPLVIRLKRVIVNLCDQIDRPNVKSKINDIIKQGFRGTDRADYEAKMLEQMFRDRKSLNKILGEIIEIVKSNVIVNNDIQKELERFVKNDDVNYSDLGQWFDAQRDFLKIALEVDRDFKNAKLKQISLQSWLPSIELVSINTIDMTDLFPKCSPLVNKIDRKDLFPKFTQLVKTKSCVVIRGPSGSGKTVFLHDFGHHFQNILSEKNIVRWFDGRSRQSIWNDYIDLALELGLTHQMPKFALNFKLHAKLAETRSTILFLFDDVSNLDDLKELRRSLPKNVRFLVTTNASKKSNEHFQVHDVEMPELDKSVCFGYLSEKFADRFDIQEVQYLVNNHAITKPFNEKTFLTISKETWKKKEKNNIKPKEETTAAAVAGECVHNLNNESNKEEKEEEEQQEEDENEEDSNVNYGNFYPFKLCCLAAVLDLNDDWDIKNYEHELKNLHRLNIPDLLMNVYLILKNLKAGFPTAYEILQISRYLDIDAIAKLFLENSIEINNTNEEIKLEKELFCLINLALLKKYSLNLNIDKLVNEGYMMHSIVKYTLETFIIESSDDTKGELAKREVDIIKLTNIVNEHMRLIERTDEVESSWKKTKALYQSAAKLVSYEIKLDQDKEKRKLLRRNKSLTTNINLKAAPMSVDAVDESALSPETSGVQTQADFFVSDADRKTMFKNRRNRAELFEKVLNYNKIVFSDYVKSLSYLLQDLKIKRNFFRTDLNLEIALSLNNIGLAYEKLGENKEAFSYLLKSNQITTELIATDRHDKRYLALTKNNLGTLEMKTGNLAHGLELKNEAYADRKKIHGDFSHDDLATSLNNVGLTNQKLGKFNDANVQLSRALKMNIELYKDDNPKIIMSLNNLANLQLQTGNFLDALKNLEKAVAMNNRVYKTPNMDQAQTLNNLGSVLLKLSKTEEATKCFNDAMDILDSLYCGNHLNKLPVLNNLGQACYATGECEKALKWFESYLNMAWTMSEEKKIYFLVLDKAKVNETMGNIYESELKDKDDGRTKVINHYTAAMKLYEEAAWPKASARLKSKIKMINLKKRARRMIPLFEQVRRFNRKQTTDDDDDDNDE